MIDAAAILNREGFVPRNRGGKTETSDNWQMHRLTEMGWSPYSRQSRGGHRAASSSGCS